MRRKFNVDVRWLRGQPHTEVREVSVEIPGKSHSDYLIQMPHLSLIQLRIHW